MPEVIEDLLESDAGHKVSVTDEGEIRLEASKGTELTLSTDEAEAALDADDETHVDIREDVTAFIQNSHDLHDIHFGDGELKFGDHMLSVDKIPVGGEHLVSVPRGPLKEAVESLSAEA